MNRPLPEAAFNGEQELLVAPEDLFMRNKREWESSLSSLTFKNHIRLTNLSIGKSLKKNA